MEKQLHRTIAKVEGDVERLAFNTAIAALIGFVNAGTTGGGLSRSQAERFARVLAPFAPHMAEELWQQARHARLHHAWPAGPAYDEAQLRTTAWRCPCRSWARCATASWCPPT